MEKAASVTRQFLDMSDPSPSRSDGKKSEGFASARNNMCSKVTHETNQITSEGAKNIGDASDEVYRCRKARVSIRTRSDLSVVRISKPSLHAFKKHWIFMHCHL